MNLFRVSSLAAAVLFSVCTFSILSLGTSQGVSQPQQSIQTSIYLEEALHSQKQILSNSTRVRLEKSWGSLSAYLQAGNESQSASDYPLIVDRSSHIYAGSGIRLSIQNLSFYMEARLRKYYLNSSPPVDLRGLAVWGSSSQTELISTRLSLFTEIYSEVLFTAADQSNIILAGFGRLGTRYHLSQSLMADLFIEPFLTLDRVGHYYHNLADIKLSSRFQVSISRIQLSLTLSYLYNGYFGYADFEPNPYSNRNQGIRLLLALGSQF